MFWRSAIFMIWRMGEGRVICSCTSRDSGTAVVRDIARMIPYDPRYLQRRGNPAGYRARLTAQRGSPMPAIDAMKQDVRGAVRGLWKSPAFAAASLLTLALGIGATSAIFSVVKAVLLTPLPYSAPEQRVLVWSKWISFDKTWLSTQELYDYRQFSKTMMAVAAWSSGQQNLTGDGEPVRVGVGFVTANTMDVLGATPMLGRMFTAAEDRPNGPPVAVLGYPLWQARYAGDPTVVGRTIMLNGVPVQVIGVMPNGFRLPTDFTVEAAEPTQLWRPLQIDEQNLNRGNHGLYGAAQLAPGQTPASATEELRAITRRLTEQGAYPQAMQFTAFAVGLDDEIRGEMRPAMWLLMGAVGFLLLIACVNVANLLLVRGDARLREMAVRTAIGAAPNRLVRQLFTESVVLAVAGALLGLALAAAALRLLVTIDPTSLPPLAPIRLDLTVVLFTLALGVITTLLFGLAPALRTLHVNLVEWLREGGQQATLGGRRQRLRSALVAIEVALAVVLVIGAGLMIRSLSQLGRIDLGFNPDRLLTMRVQLPVSAYDTPEKVVGVLRAADGARARAARGRARGSRALAAAGDDDRRFRSGRGGLRRSAGAERQGRLADRVGRCVRGDGRAAGARPLVHRDRYDGGGACRGRERDAGANLLPRRQRGGRTDSRRRRWPTRGSA